MITTAILGAGLLGGSLALALRNTRRVILYARRPEAIAQLHQVGLAATSDPHEAVSNAQEILFCVPAQATIQLARQLRVTIRPGSFITDVVSTKTNIVRVLQPLFKNHAYFVGSHPMAGSEKSGFSAARADLFQDANVILTPTRFTPQPAVAWATEFWKSLHMHVHLLSPRAHDQAVAQISHLPHLIAATLVASASPQAILLAGPGFRDTTRIAASSPDLWTEIFLDNAPSTIKATETFVRNLRQLIQAIRKKNSKKLLQYLSSAAKKRVPLTAQHPPIK
ncbi:MAG: prephenate dehydrogenase/arogenate dehydrogenase family protein [Methylacidiphilales bacterium]|nr:prephenate dehydrogenase/arogenate dehydrogenase family protein [Candidatus Methylacidiphilales bacterium]